MMCMREASAQRTALLLPPKTRLRQGLDTMSSRMSSSRSTVRSVLLVSTLALAMLGNVASSATTSIALPAIGQHLNIPASELDWVVSAYTLSSACLFIFLGRLADLFGRKRAFVGGMVFSAALSLGCGFAQDALTLDILRGIQGIGVAAAIPAAVGILAHTFPSGTRARSLAFATFSAAAPVGAALGSVIGGMLTQETSLGWRSNFFFIAALWLASAGGGLLVIEADPPLRGMLTGDQGSDDRRVDWLGALLVTAGLVLVVFVLSQSQTAKDGWRTPYIIALLVIGIISLAFFVLWERFLERASEKAASSVVLKRSRWTPPPLLRPSLLTRAGGRLAALFVIALLNNASFLAWQFWAQLYYQTYLGLNPLQTMLRLLPMFVSAVLADVFVAYVVGRVDVMPLIAFGAICTACAPLLFALLDPTASYWAFGFPAATLVAIGSDFLATAGSLFVARVAAPDEQSLAGAMLQTTTQLGTAFGITASTIAYGSSGVLGGKAAQLAGYRSAQWCAFGLGIAGAVLAVLFLRGVGVVGHDAVEINSSTTPEEKSGLDDVGDPDKGQFHAVDEEALHERSSV